MHDRAIAQLKTPPTGTIAGIPLPIWRNLLIAGGLAVAIAVPFAAKNFFIFQMSLAIIYAIAILGLNLLTGFNGQFSLGHSAFYALGAYTAAILMEMGGVPYALTLPVAGL